MNENSVHRNVQQIKGNLYCCALVLSMIKSNAVEITLQGSLTWTPSYKLQTKQSQSIRICRGKKSYAMNTSPLPHLWAHWSDFIRRVLADQIGLWLEKWCDTWPKKL